jgi:putative ABC transport system permease protein
MLMGLRLFTLRHWRQAPTKTGLLIFILAMGVSVYLAIRLANRAAVSSFEIFSQRLTGDSDFTLRAAAGGMPVEWLIDVRDGLEDLDVALIPIVESTGVLPRNDGSGDGDVFQLLGIDLFAGVDLGYAPGLENPEGQDEPFWRQPFTPLWISDDFAAEHSLKSGDKLDLFVHDRMRNFIIYGVMESKDGRTLGDVLVTDLPALQVLTGVTGSVDYVEVRREDQRIEVDTLGERIRQIADNRFEVQAPENRRETGERLTRAFRYNLTILSLMALVVGLFLIHQAMDGAVVRRRGEIAAMRALGVSSGEVYRTWLMEALLLGLIGSGLGVLLGWAMAQWAVIAVGRTVNALYMSTSVDAAALQWEEAVAGLLLGTLASIIACIGPARRAAQTPPAQLLSHFEHERPEKQGNLRWWGIVLLAAGVVVYNLPMNTLLGDSGHPVGGYGSALLLIAGGALLIPDLLSLLPKILPSGSSGAWQLALSRYRQVTGRHRFTAAGLFVSIVLTGSMAIMVHSFEGTVVSWINRMLISDLYMRPIGIESNSTRNRITDETLAMLEAHPDITRIVGVHRMDATLEGRDVVLQATDFKDVEANNVHSWVAEPRNWNLRNDEGLTHVFVSEAYSIHANKELNSRMTLTTPQGERTLEIAGIYAEYGNQRGSVLLPQDAYRTWFGDPLYMAVAMDVREGADVTELRQSLMRDNPGLFVRTNGEIKVLALKVFRQTFSLTYALEAIGVFVAVVGLAFALISLLLERRRELTTLRSLGMHRNEMAKATASEGLLLSLWGGVGGLIVSLAVAHILVFNINRHVFGWTLSFEIPWGQLAILLVGVTATGALVSYMIGKWGAMLPAEREE